MADTVVEVVEVCGGELTTSIFQNKKLTYRIVKIYDVRKSIVVSLTLSYKLLH